MQKSTVVYLVKAATPWMVLPPEMLLIVYDNPARAALVPAKKPLTEVLHEPEHGNVEPAKLVVAIVPVKVDPVNVTGVAPVV